MTNVHPFNDFFSPHEQKNGSFHRTVDIYALAACLYYGLTAYFPEPSSNRMAYKTPLIKPSKHNSRISAKVEKAILKGMKQEAEERPQSMQGWLNRLPQSKLWLWQRLKLWLWQRLIEVRQLIANCLNTAFSRLVR